MSSEYRALVDKVEAFTSIAFERRKQDMACAKGCSSCCEVSLTVSAVAAAEIKQGLALLSAKDRARVAQRAARLRAQQDRDGSEQTHAHPARCVMLEEDGSCIVYAHRPLVCRTQGHALRYPPGFIPEAAVRARSSRGEVTHCPLNFTEAAPEPGDVLDAERIDQILVVVAQRFALANQLDPDERVTLTELALG